jgi:hypothetical protein
MAIDIDLPFVPSGSALGERITRKQRNPSARHQALLEAMKLFPETPLRLVAPDLQLGYSVEGSIEARTRIQTRTGSRSMHGLSTTTEARWCSD